VAQQLVNLPHEVLAQPSADGRGYRVVAVIKGEKPAGGMIPEEELELDVVPDANATLLLARDEAWSMWVAFGAVAVEHAGWLRQIAAGKHLSDMNADEWRAQLALILPYLEDREPLARRSKACGTTISVPSAARNCRRRRGCCGPRGATRGVVDGGRRHESRLDDRG